MAGELILIIEDNDKNLKLVRDVLQFNSYKTAEAMTAEDGLVLARSRHPALILLDIQLPGMDGFAALRQLRADPITTSTPVMAVTASAMEQDRQKILAAGFDGYMTKPINVKQFIEEIRTALVTRCRHVTASAMTLDRQQIMAAGFKGYGTKPIQIREFAEEVRTILDRCVGTSAGGA